MEDKEKRRERIAQTLRKQGYRAKIENGYLVQETCDNDEIGHTVDVNTTWLGPLAIEAFENELSIQN